MATTLYGADLQKAISLLMQIDQNLTTIARAEFDTDGEGAYDCELEGQTVCLYAEEIVTIFERRIKELNLMLAPLGIAYADEASRPQLVAAKRPIDVTQPGETK